MEPTWRWVAHSFSEEVAGAIWAAVAYEVIPILAFLAALRCRYNATLPRQACFSTSVLEGGVAFVWVAACRCGRQRTAT